MASRRTLVTAILLTSFLPLYAADTPSPAANSDPTYQQLRNLTLGGEAVKVTNFVLKRDAGRFNLRSGTVCFVAPVQGKVTGAVFTGDGNFVEIQGTAEREPFSRELLDELLGLAVAGCAELTGMQRQALSTP